MTVAGVVGGDFDFGAARLDPGGALDPAFGAAGRTSITFGAIDAAFGAAVLPGGGTVLAGTRIAAPTRAVVARLLGDPVPPPDSGSPPPARPKTRCGGRAATIVGTPGPDRLRGTRGRDVIAGLGGNDRIDGLSGADLICGGPGADVLLGGKGRDRILGGKGRDRISGGPGRDRLLGGPGRDRCDGGPGRDEARCELVLRSP